MTTTAATPIPTTTDSASAPLAAARRHADRRRLARAGAWGGLISAPTYIAGFGLLGAYLAPAGFLEGEDDPAAAMRFLLDHQAVLYAWYTVLYLVAGAALAVLVVAMHDRLRSEEPGTSALATALGLIWSGLLFASGMIALVGQQAVVHLHEIDPAAATSTWTTVGIVQDALGGGIELVGGLWVLLVAWAGLSSGRLGRGLCRLGLVLGVAGVLTVVPAFAPAAAIFGLGFIGWFGWAGRTLQRAG